jgi:hypothetical protein
VGQEVHSRGYKHVERMGVGWGLWSWATIKADRMEKGKGPTCALFKGIEKMLDLGFTFTRRVGYCNPNLGFATKRGVQKPWSQENMFRCETHSHKWGSVQRMEPNDFQVHSHLCGSCECSKPWLEKQTNTKLGPHDTLKRSWSVDV